MVPGGEGLSALSTGHLQSDTAGRGMRMNVLVAFSSKHGSTREIAERIGQRLREGGITAAVIDVRDVKDLGGYGAVVIGSAVYMGSWRKEAVEFAKENREALAALPVWLFSSGPLGEPTLEDPKPVPELRGEIGPKDHRVFAGALDKSKLSLPEKLVVAAVKSQMKTPHELLGDFRDWHEIDAWAGEIVGALAMAPSEVR
jgi:menaquinone-dependent protoporphyrinogen oxidase